MAEAVPPAASAPIARFWRLKMFLARCFAEDAGACAAHEGTDGLRTCRSQPGGEHYYYWQQRDQPPM